MAVNQMNKRGFLATIFLALMIVVFIIGLFAYFKIRTTGLEFSTGNIIIGIRYNDSAAKTTTESISPEQNSIINEEPAENISTNPPENTTPLDASESFPDYQELTNLSQ